MSYRFGMTWDHHCTICLTYPPSMILCNNVFHLSCGQIIFKQLTQTVRGPRTVFTPAALYAGLVVRIQMIVCVIKVVRVWRGFLWSYMVGCVCVCVCWWSHLAAGTRWSSYPQVYYSHTAADYPALWTLQATLKNKTITELLKATVATSMGNWKWLF